MGEKVCVCERTERSRRRGNYIQILSYEKKINKRKKEENMVQQKRKEN